MSGTFKIIPRLDIKGHNLVKGMHLKELRVLSDLKKYFQDNKKNKKMTIVTVGLEKYFQCFKKGTIKNFLQTVK